MRSPCASGTAIAAALLTRGMSVFDVRWGSTAKPNVELATGVDVAAVRQYIQRTLAALPEPGGNG